MQIEARQRALDPHFDAHPERFVRGPPQMPRLPVAVRITRPDETHVQMTDVEDATTAFTSRAQNQAAEARPSAAGHPAQRRAAPAEGAAAMAEPTGRVPPGTRGAR